MNRLDAAKSISMITMVIMRLEFKIFERNGKKKPSCKS